ncbi:MAG: hypothetical protein K8S55_11310 [Phycisphaerae bacterium]|nr:hypothetical protein [Phycisphaerae bacterium]
MTDWTSLFDARFDVTPPVAEEQLVQVPAKRGVVLLAGGDNEPIVMLTAADMRSRTRIRLANPREDQSTTRSRSPDLREITRGIYYCRCESHFETDWRFLELARQVWPGRYKSMVGWKPPWFIHLDTAESYPHFSRSREVFGHGGQYLGPFAGGRDADKFIDVLADAFNLCRSISCLRNAPNGPRCAYAEMNRCCSPADGTISMDEYRLILQKAVDFAAGRRDELPKQLRGEMADAAAALKFELAGSIKTRLERLGFFDGRQYHHVVPAERFSYILAQPGDGVHELRLFFVHRGEICYGGAVKYPLEPDTLNPPLKAMRRFAKSDLPVDEVGLLRMGLAARTLFAPEARRGLVLNWREDTTAEELAAFIEAGHEALGVRRRISAKKDTAKGSAAPDSPNEYNTPNTDKAE